MGVSAGFPVLVRGGVYGKESARLIGDQGLVGAVHHPEHHHPHRRHLFGAGHGKHKCDPASRDTPDIYAYGR